MLQNPKKAWASDANFTLRLTYGRVLPYSPADGIEYNYYTTLKGVMEKENPQNPTEFTVPEKLKELYAARDFGRYANAGGELPVAFLADCDITGGNSGSPVMNARGALLGWLSTATGKPCRAMWLSSPICSVRYRSISATCCSSSTSSRVQDGCSTSW